MKETQCASDPLFVFLHKRPLPHGAPWGFVDTLFSNNAMVNQTDHSSQTRIAFIQSSWHTDIVTQGREAFLAELEKLGSPADSVDLFKVPGAFEIPLHAQKLAATGRYSVIVACGFVVNGGIYRHDFVADAVISGLMKVQLDSGVPVFSVVLTPLHFHEHADHQQFFANHFVTKGKEAAQACLQTLESLLAIG
jgi:6,7-dimethyl-8-ribityllumazine synthase